MSHLAAQFVHFVNAGIARLRSHLAQLAPDRPPRPNPEIRGGVRAKTELRNRVFANAILGPLQKTYWALMQSIRERRFNGDDARTKELNSNNGKSEELGNDFRDLRGSGIQAAAQRSLRLNLIRAGVASKAPARSGASRTQAPSRPRRLHFFWPSLLVRLYTTTSRKW